MNIEELREQIVAIQEAVDRISESGINDKALFLLIQQACPVYGDRYNKKKPGIPMIRAVLAGMENLQDFVFGEVDSKDDDE